MAESGARHKGKIRNRNNLLHQQWVTECR